MLAADEVVASVGATTSAPSLSDQVKRYQSRNFIGIDEDGDDDHPAHESLQRKCLRALTANFSDRPQLDGLPPEFVRAITAELPTDLDVTVTGPAVSDESYWKRCCLTHPGWRNAQIANHGQTWKQLFFEQYVQELLEEFDPSNEELSVLLARVRAAQDNVFTLRIRQLLSHLDMAAVCALLPNLTALDLTYGVKRVGMRYERMIFGLKISDATSIAKLIRNTSSLTTLVLSGNLMDDDLLRMLMTGLIKNATIAHLDLSHNKITNHGARLLSKLLGPKSVLTSLDLCDNMIHAEGGRYLGRSLRHNESLVDLNLRLNRLTDEGGRMLFEGMRENTTLQRLNLSANSVASQAATALAAILQDPSAPLITVDLSCNELRDEDANTLQHAMQDNSVLIALDLRMNKLSDDSVEEGVQRLVHRNELDVRDVAVGTPGGGPVGGGSAEP